MEQTVKPVHELIRVLPVEIQQEVEDFIEFLLERRGYKPRRTFKLDWRGDLSDLRDKYTSVDLQHKMLDWWGD